MVNELVNEIKETLDQFVVNADKNVNGNKAAGTRARKLSLKIANLMKQYRAVSIKNDKAEKDA